MTWYPGTYVDLDTRAPRHPGTQVPRYPAPRALCHLLTGSHGVGSNGPQEFNVSVIDESLTIQGSYSISIDFDFL